jgi:Na+/proline symporter
VKRYLWLIAAAFLAVVAASTWFALHDPKVLGGLVTLAVGAFAKHLWPHILVALKPRPLTRDQIQISREGGDYNSPRKFGRQKGE